MTGTSPATGGQHRPTAATPQGRGPPLGPSTSAQLYFRRRRKGTRVARSSRPAKFFRTSDTRARGQEARGPRPNEGTEARETRGRGRGPGDGATPGAEGRKREPRDEDDSEGEAPRARHRGRGARNGARNGARATRVRLRPPPSAAAKFAANTLDGTAPQRRNLERAQALPDDHGSARWLRRDFARRGLWVRVPSSPPR